MRQFPTVESLAHAELDDVLKRWEGLGYYTRAHNLHRAAHIILQKHHGKFPEKYSDVLDLPGIGRYTAGAICSIAFNQPTPILDGNVTRVLSRLFGIKEAVRSPSAQDRLWKLAEQLVRVAAVHRSCSALNESLMELGAIICTPREPNCTHCPVAKYCYARRHNAVHRLPIVNSRPEPTRRRFVALALQHRGRWLVRRRPADSVNGRLWEFPNAEVPGDAMSPDVLSVLGFGSASSKLPNAHCLCTIRHSITRYRIQLDVFTATSPDGPASSQALAGKWCRLAELDKLTFPSAHRKIVELLKQQAHAARS